METDENKKLTDVILDGDKLSFRGQDVLPRYEFVQDYECALAKPNTYITFKKGDVNIGHLIKVEGGAGEMVKMNIADGSRHDVPAKFVTSVGSSTPIGKQETRGVIITKSPIFKSAAPKKSEPVKFWTKGNIILAIVIAGFMIAGYKSGT